MAARFFGQYLLEKGAISAESLLKAVALQDSTNLKLGAYAMLAGVLTAQQADELNAAQRKTDRMFGDLAIERGYLTPAQLQDLLARQKKSHLYIGEALVRVNGLKKDVLERELAIFKKEQEAQGPHGPIAAPDLPHGREIALLVDFTVKLLRRTSAILGRASGVALDRRALDATYLEAVIPFKGSFEGRYGLRVPKNVAQLISKGMIGTVATTDADLADAVEQLCNVVAGNVCAAIASEGLLAEILPPEHSVPAPRREVRPGMGMALYTVDTVHGPISVFFESRQAMPRST